jgi:anti-sigma regulatory factor (Ser/Thr protein kinase)
MTLRAEEWAAGVARTELAAWLEIVGWPLAHRAGIVAAVSEAIDNVAVHAYPPVEDVDAGPRSEMWGAVSVEAVVLAGVGTRRVRVVVRDWGSWNPLSVLNTEGAGLQLMGEVMAEVRVRPGSPEHVPGDNTGTEVTLISSAVPHRPE